MIVCTKCGIAQDETEFYRYKSSKNKYHSHCAECQRINARNRYAGRINSNIRETERKCTHCKKWLPYEAFPKSTGGVKGKKSVCKKCTAKTMRKNHLLKRYNLKETLYNEMLENQGGTCAICNKKETKRNLAVDHDHKTGRIRGLLCIQCNTALGKFNDDVELLEKAKEYLKKS